MEVLYSVLVVAHLAGMAAIVGGWMTVARAPRMHPVMVEGTGAQLVTGVALAGLASSGLAGDEIDNAKIAVKLGIALVVAVIAYGGRRRGTTRPGAVHAVGGLALVNVAVAVLWQ